MNERLSRWLNLSQYPAGAERNRAMQIGLVLLVIGVALVLALIQSVVLALAQGTIADNLLLWAIFAGIGVLSVAGWTLLRQGHMEAAANLVTLGIFVGLVIFMWPQEFSASVSADLVVSVLFVAIIARWYVSLLFTIGVSVYATAHLWAENTGLLTVTGEEAGSLLPAFFAAFAALIAFATAAGLVSNLRRATQRAEERLTSMALTSQISARLASAVDVPWLVDQAIDLLMEHATRFDHVRIYLMDGERVVGVCSSDEGWREITHPSQAPPLYGGSILGRVVAERRPVLVRDTQFQPSRSDGELFANTRAVLALPLLVGDALTGVIELQSLTPNAFSPADAELLQPVADLIAVAVARTEMIAEARKRAQQAERRLAEAEARTARIRREQAHEAMQSWRQYLQSVGGGQVLQLDLQSMTTLRYEGWTPALDAAIEQGAVVKDVSGTANVVAVPIRVGGEVVGAMEFELERLPSEQEMGVLSQITDRFGLAAESSRLLFETRRIADREVQVNEIGARLQTATDLEGVLVSAAEGLRDTLGAPRVSVRIGLPARERLHDGGGA